MVQPTKVAIVGGGCAAMAAAFELTRPAIGYRRLQLLALPIETMAPAALQKALEDIGRS